MTTRRAKSYGTHKYHAVRTVVDGITFPSKAEAVRYGTLCDAQRAGEISDLVLQPKFALTVNGVHICNYVADFQYRKPAGGAVVVEDVKGMRTRIFALKKKLVLACTGVEVLEVDKRGNVKPARKVRAQRPRRKAAKR